MFAECWFLSTSDSMNIPLSTMGMPLLRRRSMALLLLVANNWGRDVGTLAWVLPAVRPRTGLAGLPIRDTISLAAEKQVQRCFVFRNATCAHGIVEFAPPDTVASIPGGRLRTFSTLGADLGQDETPAPPCTIAELPFKEGGLGSKVWESSLALACWARLNSAAVNQKHVLELGSGCGLGGVMLAATGARSVTLSDFHGEHEEFVAKDDGTLVSARMKQGTGVYSVSQGVYADGSGSISFPLMRNLEENVLRNSHCLKHHCDLEVSCLDWAAAIGGEQVMETAVGPSKNLGTFDLVCGSDCIYAEEAVEPLAATTLKHMARGGQAVFISPSARTGLTEFIMRLRGCAGQECAMRVSEYTIHEFEAVSLGSSDAGWQWVGGRDKADESLVQQAHVKAVLESIHAKAELRARPWMVPLTVIELSRSDA